MKRVRQRRVHGISLVEMLATILIMGIVAAAITEITVTQNVVAFRTFNKLDALTNARRVASFIERDIHNACYIGSETTAPGPAISLSPQILILQMPIFYSPSSTLANGISAIPTGGTATAIVIINGTPVPLPMATKNCDTVIYQVVGDTTRPGTGQFVLQKTVYPGLHAPAYPNYESAAVATDQAILTGIVGPLDLTQPVDPTAGTPPPAVFGYFSKLTPMYGGNYQAGSVLAPSNINGVSINLEVFSNQSSKRIDLTPRSMAFRTEAYVRGNYYSP
jgi:Tfp pilus assembly protein PilE